MIVVRDACDAGSQNQTVNDTLMDLIFPRMSRVRMTDEVLEMIREAARKGTLSDCDRQYSS